MRDDRRTLKRLERDALDSLSIEELDAFLSDRDPAERAATKAVLDCLSDDELACIVALPLGSPFRAAVVERGPVETWRQYATWDEYTRALARGLVDGAT